MIRTLKLLLDMCDNSGRMDLIQQAQALAVRSRAQHHKLFGHGGAVDNKPGQHTRVL
jgi:hypothetical protein